MKPRFTYMLSLVSLVVLPVGVLAGTTTLKAAKDNFGRSNKRNNNSGASSTLYIAHADNLRTIVAFDLSVVTNRILSATFRFHQAAANPNDMSLTVSAMAATEQNAAWVEGLGSLGTAGQNARPGESCYSRLAFPDSLWEYDDGKTVTDLGDARLWKKALVTRKKLSWEEDAWVEIPITDLAMLEKARTAGPSMLTFGLWGTSGNGFYALSSKESGSAPELVLETEGGP